MQAFLRLFIASSAYLKFRTAFWLTQVLSNYFAFQAVLIRRKKATPLALLAYLSFLAPLTLLEAPT